MTRSIYTHVADRSAGACLRPSGGTWAASTGPGLVDAQTWGDTRQLALIEMAPVRGGVIA